MGSKLRQLFFLSLLLTSCLAEMRFFPHRYQQIYEEHNSPADTFLRRLEQDDLNSQNQNRLNSPRISLRLRGDTELGYYYITLFFGTPIQRQTLIVDTGSSVTAIPCGGCDCGPNHFDYEFNTSSSETFKEIGCYEQIGEYTCSDCNGKCYFHSGYAEGSSYNGNYKKDYVMFGDEAEKYYEILRKLSQDGANSGNEENDVGSRRTEQLELEQLIQQRRVVMPFGCISKETKLFYDQEADGIMGLGTRTNARGNPPNLLDMFEMSNANHSKAFSLCFAQTGGYLTVGGFNTEHHNKEEKIQYVPYAHEANQYRVYLKDVTVEGESFGLSPRDLNKRSGVFFDSGTTFTHVPSATLRAFKSSFNKFCDKDSKNCAGTAPLNKEKLCWKYDSEKFPTLAEFFATFPPFNFVFGEEANANYEWRAEDYFYKYDANKPYYCVGITEYESETILGGTFMKNHDVLFDKNQKLLGFVRSNCSALNEGAPLIKKETSLLYKNPNSNEPKKPEIKFPQPELPVDEPDVPKEPIPSQEGDHKAKIVIVLALGLILATACFIYIKIKRKGKYNDMGGDGQNELRNGSEDSNNIENASPEDGSRVNSEFEI